MKKIFNSKIFVVLVLVVAVCALMTSCFGSKKTASIITVSVTAVEGNSLDSQQLSDIATLIRNNADARDAFIAAYRGYNVFAEGFDKNLESYPVIKDENGNNVISVEGAKATIGEYNKDSAISFDYSTLNAKDVESIVFAMQETVSLAENRDLLGNIRFYIGSALGWITKTVGFGNYLIAICIFAILVEILMIPLSIKQQKNSIKQAKLRPKEMAIRNRYKGRNDQATQQKVTQEIQELYQRENFNPMSGCLPLLIQLPIIMLLYNIVVDPLQNVLGCSAGFSQALRTFATTSKMAGGLGMNLKASNGTIELLSQIKNVDFSGLADFAFFRNSGELFEEFASISGKIPSFNVVGLNFGLTPSFKGNYLLLIVPVITFVTYFFSMKLTKKFTYQPTQNENAPGAGCSSKMMEYYMPLVSTFFCFMVPGAVGIYWVFKSILSTIKQYIISKIMPLPVFTEEDFKEAERELGVTKKPQRKRKGESNLDPDRERPRSLHHIDDDDEEYVTFIN